jgi:hypothetical protein
MTDQAQNMARGIELAKKCIHDIADNDETMALARLRHASPAETTVAAAYLLSCLRATVLTMVGGDLAATARGLHAGANETEDVVVTQAKLVIDAAFKREGVN